MRGREAPSLYRLDLVSLATEVILIYCREQALPLEVGPYMFYLAIHLESILVEISISVQAILLFRMPDLFIYSQAPLELPPVVI